MLSSATPRATANALRDLRERGVLDSAQEEALLRLLRERLAWRVWIGRLLLVLGAGLLLAGVIFFFAHNWRHLAPLQKFALIEAALVLCAGGAAWSRFETLLRQVLLFAACVLVGVFLAVFGQIYQTGADSWQLFAMWALLIAPWMVLGRFAPLWLFWLALTNTAAVLFWMQAWPHSDSPVSSFANLCVVLAGLNAGVLAAREAALTWGVRWLGAEWERCVLCAAVFAWLTIANGAVVLDWQWRFAIIPLLALTIAVALNAWVFRAFRPSLFALAAAALSVSITACVLLGRWLFENFHEPVGTLFFFGVCILAIFGAAIAWLRRAARVIAAKSPAQ